MKTDMLCYVKLCCLRPKIASFALLPSARQPHLTSLVLEVVERQLFGGEAKGGKVRSV